MRSETARRPSSIELQYINIGNSCHVNICLCCNMASWLNARKGAAKLRKLEDMYVAFFFQPRLLKANICALLSPLHLPPSKKFLHPIRKQICKVVVRLFSASPNETVLCSLRIPFSALHIPYNWALWNASNKARAT